MIKAKNTPATIAHFDEFKKEMGSKLVNLELSIKEMDQRNQAQFMKIDSSFKEIDANFKDVDARFKGFDARFDKIDANFKDVDARFKGFDARFDKIDATFAEMRSIFTKIESSFTKMDATHEKMMELYHHQSVKVEEQTSKNNFVFDHLNMLFDRQDKHEQNIDQKIKNIQDAIKGV